jgi:hypothetical protein
MKMDKLPPHLDLVQDQMAHLIQSRTTLVDCDQFSLISAAAVNGGMFAIFFCRFGESFK